MDPLTAAAAVQLITAITELMKVVIESQPPDVRAELWRMHLEDMKALRSFIDSLRPRT